MESAAAQQAGNSLVTLFSPAEAGCQQVTEHWFSTTQNDVLALDIFKRHYTYKGGNYGKSHSIVGPGERMVLITAEADALFVWRKEKYRLDEQTGVNCAVFRNESCVLSSQLIREAMEAAWDRWPGERMFTFVNPDRIKSTNPGYCFRQAGWKRCGESAKGLVILEFVA